MKLNAINFGDWLEMTIIDSQDKFADLCLSSKVSGKMDFWHMSKTHFAQVCAFPVLWSEVFFCLIKFFLDKGEAIPIPAVKQAQTQFRVLQS